MTTVERNDGPSVLKHWICIQDKSTASLARSPDTMNELALLTVLGPASLTGQACRMPVGWAIQPDCCKYSEDFAGGICGILQNSLASDGFNTRELNDDMPDLSV